MSNALKFALWMAAVPLLMAYIAGGTIAAILFTRWWCVLLIPIIWGSAAFVIALLLDKLT